MIDFFKKTILLFMFVCVFFANFAFSAEEYAIAFYAITELGQVKKSLDEAATWKNIPLPDKKTPVTMAATEENELYVWYADRKTAMTPDSGISWIKNPTNSLADAAPEIPYTITDDTVIWRDNKRIVLGFTPKCFLICRQDKMYLPFDELTDAIDIDVTIPNPPKPPPQIPTNKPPVKPPTPPKPEPPVVTNTVPVNTNTNWQDIDLTDDNLNMSITNIANHPISVDPLPPPNPPKPPVSTNESVKPIPQPIPEPKPDVPVIVVPPQDDPGQHETPDQGSQEQTQPSQQEEQQPTVPIQSLGGIKAVTHEDTNKWDGVSLDTIHFKLNMHSAEWINSKLVSINETISNRYATLVSMLNIQSNAFDAKLVQQYNDLTLQIEQKYTELVEALNTQSEEFTQKLTNQYNVLNTKIEEQGETFTQMLNSQYSILDARIVENYNRISEIRDLLDERDGVLRELIESRTQELDRELLEKYGELDRRITGNYNELLDMIRHIPGGGGSMSIIGASGPDAEDVTYYNITTLKFDKTTGFTVSETDPNTVEISLGSSWTELIPDLPGQEISMNYRGYYESGREYNARSIVSYTVNSQMKYWVAEHNTTGVPGESPDWADITYNFRPSGEEKLAIKAVPANQTGTYWDYTSTNKDEKTFVIGINTSGETSSEITVAGLPSPMGRYKNGDVIPAGTSFNDIITQLLTVATPPVYTNPVFTVSLINCEAGVVEYGKQFFNGPEAKFNFKVWDAGMPNAWSLAVSSSENDWMDYGYGSDFEYSFDTSGTTVASLTRALLSISSIKSKTTITSIVCYNEGDVKNDSFGNPYPAGHVLASCMTNKLTITPSRYIYYAAQQDWQAVDTEATVKRLGNKFLYNSQASTVITVDQGTKQVTIAIPLSKIERLTSMVHKSNSMDVQTELINNPQVTVSDPISILPETGESSPNDSYIVYIYRLSTALDDSGTITVKYKAVQ